MSTAARMLAVCHGMPVGSCNPAFTCCLTACKGTTQLSTALHGLCRQCGPMCAAPLPSNGS